MRRDGIAANLDLQMTLPKGSTEGAGPEPVPPFLSVRPGRPYFAACNSGAGELALSLGMTLSAKRFICA
jgi:hypothetical protein